MGKFRLYYEDYPLGTAWFDAFKGIGNFTYIYTQDAARLIPIKPEIVITILEGIRYDVMDIKTLEDFNQYVNTKIGKFYFKEF